MGEFETVAIFTVLLVAMLLGAVVVHENTWIRTADDYTKCLSHCANEFTGDAISQEKLQCLEVCKSLSDCVKEG